MIVHTLFSNGYLLFLFSGKAGLIAEHSMMDGMPVIRFADFVTKLKYAQARRCSSALEYSSNKTISVVDIFASALDSMDYNTIENLENKAWEQFSELISKHSLHAQSFQKYGSSFIKANGFPPDAFVQVAMQLATYRLFGEQVGTYEATQVRPFL